MSEQEIPDGFRRTRIVGGTEEASRVLAWAGTELVRRQQTPLEGSESRRERWTEVLVIYVESFELLHKRDQDIIARLAEHGRQEGILISIRISPDPVPRPRPWERALDMSGEKYQPYWVSLDEIKNMIDQQWAEIQVRNDLLKDANRPSTKKGSK